ncbi:MAG: hypothetical protein H7Z21_02455 [Hymenobacter sp.]|nr:hypothetical protein [Hymenobacter sp.]
MKPDDLIRAAYDLFAPYTIGRTLEVCKCCVSDAEERELVQTPLRAVSRDLLQRAYYESARGYSAQELWEMKHFLPRVLELVSGFEFPCHSTEITFTRLDLHQPTGWTAPERALLDAFALAFFEQCLGRYPLPGDEPLSNLLLMFGLGRFDLAPLLRAWAAADSRASTLHFTDFLLHEAIFAANQRVRLRNAFSEPFVNEAVAAWLHDETVQDGFAQRLESCLLSNPALDEATVRDLSGAHDLLRALT